MQFKVSENPCEGEAPGELENPFAGETIFVSFQNLFRIGVAIKNVSLLYFNSETSSLW